MLDNNTKYSLLYSKSEKLEKRRQRLFTFLFIIPILYWLVKSSYIDEISWAFFTLDRMEVVLYVTPVIYSILIFYIFTLTEHYSEVRDQMSMLRTEEESPKNSLWYVYIHPFNIAGEILGSVRAGGVVGLLGVLLVYVPIIVVTLLAPVCFICYSNYVNFSAPKPGERSLPYGLAIFSIWMLLAAIIYMWSKEYGKKTRSKKV